MKTRSRRIILNVAMYVSLLMMTFAVSDCSISDEPKEDNGNLEADYYVATGEAIDILYNGATILASVNQDALLSISGSYKLGVVLSSKNSTPTINDIFWETDGVEAGKYKVLVSGCTSKTKYFYRACLKTSGTVFYAKETKEFTTEDESITYELAVDLGLSVKWASRNIGAERPSDDGSYFAWGETETKSNYTENNSKWHKVEYVEMKTLGVIDSNGNLASKNDAARTIWGESWRMPTWEECKELIDKCKWEKMYQDKNNGYKVTGPNGNSIYLPAAGYRAGRDLCNAGLFGGYWSASAYGNAFEAYYLYFNLSSHGCSYSYRWYGCSVRPVTE